MSATKRPRRLGPRARRAAGGAYSVEFAIVILVFLLLLFGVLELARLMYVFNTLQEVTRRAAHAAANQDFTDTAGMGALRQAAVFRGAPGVLVLGAPVSDDAIRVDYMALLPAGASMALTPIPASALPASPARNRLNCVSDPNGTACIRFVRVRVCDPGNAGGCSPLAYVSIFSLISLTPNLPTSTTIVAAESLGYAPGKPL